MYRPTAKSVESIMMRLHALTIENLLSTISWRSDRWPGYCFRAPETYRRRIRCLILSPDRWHITAISVCRIAHPHCSLQ